MYNVPYFKEKDNGLVLDFIRQHPFAMLIGCIENKPVATQVPLLIEEDAQIFLSGHMMKGTDHHKAFLQNNSALCIFTGPHTYVSASWYTNPQTGSTWNYMSVHVRGQLQFLEEADLRHILEKTTAHFENNPASPASFHRLPKDYVDRLVKAIVGFRIAVEEVDNVFKLSQNRDEASYENIIRQLHAQDEDAKIIAEEMRKRKEELYKAPK